jgi:hypothetical protein
MGITSYFELKKPYTRPRVSPEKKWPWPPVHLKLREAVWQEKRKYSKSQRLVTRASIFSESAMPGIWARTTVRWHGG